MGKSKKLNIYHKCDTPNPRYNKEPFGINNYNDKRIDRVYNSPDISKKPSYTKAYFEALLDSLEEVGSKARLLQDLASDIEMSCPLLRLLNLFLRLGTQLLV